MVSPGLLPDTSKLQIMNLYGPTIPFMSELIELFFCVVLFLIFYIAVILCILAIFHPSVHVQGLDM